MIVTNRIVEKKEITSEVLTNKHSFFTIKESDPHPNLTTKIFDATLQFVFDSFKNESNTYYLKNRWLIIKFEDLLLKKQNPIFYNQLFMIIKNFYRAHPFALDKKLVTTFFKFFQKYPSLLELVKTKEISISLGLDSLMTNFFIPKLIQLIKTDITSDSKYKNIKQMIIEALHFQIKRRLQSFDSSYVVRNNKKLWDWINAFDYEIAKKLKMHIPLYNTFFETKIEETTWLRLQEDAFKSAINKVIEFKLNVSPISPLLQVIYHYVFSNFFISKTLTPIKEEILENAQLLIENSQDDDQKKASDSYFKQKLELFLPGLSALVQKFNLNYKTLLTTNGITFSKVGGSNFLTQTDDTKKNYEFYFQLKYVTSFIEPSKKVIHTKFTIPVKDVVTPFQQAANIVERFKKLIVWNLGYKNSLEWTEKEFVEWIDEFRNFKDFLAFVTNKKRTKKESFKILKSTEWSKFSPINLERLDFSIIDSKFKFEVVPVIEFVNLPFSYIFEDLMDGRRTINELKKSKASFYHTQIYKLRNIFGGIRVHLQLKQFVVNLDNTKRLVRESNFQVRDLTKILSMPELIKKKVESKFPRLLSYDQWLDKGNQMWINEWLDDNWKARLKYTKTSEWEKRTNFLEIKEFIYRFIININQEYRNDFEIAKKSYYAEELKGDLTSPENVDADFLSVNLLFRDTQSETNFFEIHFFKILKNFNSFEDIKEGYYAQKAIQSEFIEKLKKAYLIQPAHDQYKDGEKVALDAVFQVGDEQITFKEILGRLEAFGFKVSEFSKPQTIMEGTINNKTGNYIYFQFSPEEFRTIYNIKRWFKVSYSVSYYDFINGKNKTKLMKFYLHLINEMSNPIIASQDMEKHYREIINNLDDNLESDQNLKAEINKIMNDAKKNGAWKTDLTKWDFLDILDQAKQFIANYSPTTIIQSKIADLYDGQIPNSVLEKLKNKEYSDVFKKILENRGNFSKKNMQQIFSNANLINLLKNQKEFDLSKTLTQYAKISNSTKYAYLGSGIGFGIVGLLSGLTSLRHIRLYIKTNQVQTKFKKSRTISIFSLVVSFLTIAASAVLTLLFFIEKGGF